MTALFIADLHLDDLRPRVTDAFFDFLRVEALQADELYILGDLFEVWIGDDDDAHLAAAVRSALREVSDSGTQVYLQHGNRDFMLDRDFAADTGARFIDEGSRIELPDAVPTIVLHGDSLCTRDTAYMEWRAKARSPEFQQQLLALGLEERRALVAGLRAQSQEANSNKAEDIMDVTPDEVIAVMTAANARRMIHGHTHRPAVHNIEVAGEPAQRIVVGDWDQNFVYALADESGCRLAHRKI